MEEAHGRGLPGLEHKKTAERLIALPSCSLKQRRVKTLRCFSNKLHREAPIGTVDPVTVLIRYVVSFNPGGRVVPKSRNSRY